MCFDFMPLLVSDRMYCQKRDGSEDKSNIWESREHILNHATVRLWKHEKPYQWGIDLIEIKAISSLEYTLPKGL